MKRKAITIVLCVAVLCASAGCEHKKEEEKPSYSVAQVQKQNSESYEDALKECFNASYSLGGGEVFYEYMYPDAAIEAMKAAGQYETLVATFNQGQETRIGQNDEKLTFDKVTECHDINDTQEAAVKNYFKTMCEPFVQEVTEDQFNVGEGYEVNYSYLRNGEEGGIDTVLVVKLNDEGWKVITG
ncbi:hypothetical protein [Ruminococcus sp.]|uniref:hypothetical protein n=1 Tax=Ruminococcus sp. TaxID=41978 RepID=UPI001B79BC87|nr:hypothetical protein [Ruminococcus sp.]MBP5432500.1 hypothetical protein [Ruminococcus sp.]